MKRIIIASVVFLLSIAGFAFVTTCSSSTGFTPEPYPLHTAAIHWPERIGGLVESGLSPDEANDTGVTPLQSAVSHRAQLGVAKLLSLGADPNIGNSDGNSPLAQAAMWGDLQTVRLLISFGADVNAEYQTRPALHHAIVHDHSEIIDLLLKQPNIDLNQRSTGSGYTPLHLAVQHDCDTVVKTLLVEHADIEIRDRAGNTPHDLAEQKLDKTLALLLKPVQK
jgi:ankyrin repeat protein